MVVDPGCMKCMDCITICPNDALYYGFTPVVSRKRDPVRKPAVTYDLSWGEEFLVLFLFAVCFGVFFQLYQTIPLLMAIGQLG